jgi:hypothetical protein
MKEKLRLSRMPALAKRASGTHRSASSVTPLASGGDVNPAGMTPTTEYGLPSSKIGRPIAAGSRRNARSDSASLKITTRAAVG